MQALELRLHFRADEQLPRERLRGPGLDGAFRTNDAGDHGVATHLDPVDVRRLGLRNDRAQEVVLDRGYPAVGRGEFDRPLLQQVFPLVLFGLVAVVGLRSVERVGVDVEHRPVHTLRATQELRVLIAAPRLVAVVVQRLLDLDDVAAAAQVEALLDRDATLVGPGQRHDEVVGITEGVLAARGAEQRVLVGGCAGCAAQPGTNEAEITGFRAQQFDEFVRLVFVDRVAQDRCADERAPAGRYLQLEYVGTYRDDIALRIRSGGLGTR